MFTRRVRDLESKLAAATAAAAAAAAAATAAGSSRRITGIGSKASSTRRASAAGAGAEGLRRGSSTDSTGRNCVTQQQRTKQQQAQQPEALFKAGGAVQDDPIASAAATAAADSAALGQLAGSAALRLRERQVAALTAQLDERTTQVRGAIMATVQCFFGGGGLPRQLGGAPPVVVLEVMVHV
jgi:hypothetical protein